MKTVIFGNKQALAKLKSYFPVVRKPLMKSMEIGFHGMDGNRRGWYFISLLVFAWNASKIVIEGATKLCQNGCHLKKTHFSKM